jgi:hypothetical protein
MRSVTSRSWLLVLLAEAACGRGGAAAPGHAATNDAHHGDVGLLDSAAGDGPAPSVDGSGGDIGGTEVRRGAPCQELCTSPWLASCPADAPPSCNGGCEYNAAANSGCFEFYPLVLCILDAQGNPFECIDSRASLRNDVCVAQRRAFCQNPRCQFGPPTVPGCTGM